MCLMRLSIANDSVRSSVSGLQTEARHESIAVVRPGRGLVVQECSQHSGLCGAYIRDEIRLHVEMVPVSMRTIITISNCDKRNLNLAQYVVSPPDSRSATSAR